MIVPILAVVAVVAIFSVPNIYAQTYSETLDAETIYGAYRLDSGPTGCTTVGNSTAPSLAYPATLKYLGQFAPDGSTKTCYQPGTHFNSSINATSTTQILNASVRGITMTADSSSDQCYVVAHAGEWPDRLTALRLILDNIAGSTTYASSSFACSSSSRDVALNDVGKAIILDALQNHEGEFTIGIVDPASRAQNLRYFHSTTGDFDFVINARTPLPAPPPEPEPEPSPPPAPVAPTVSLPDTQVCFLNYNLSFVEMWKACGVEDDWLAFLVLPFNWITGGFISLVILAILVWAVWLKYHNALYPLITGIMFLPVAYAFFPEQFLSTVIIIGFFTLGVSLWYAFIRQTRE